MAIAVEAVTIGGRIPIVGRVVHINDSVANCQPGVIAYVLDEERGVINAGGWRHHGGAASWQAATFDEAMVRMYSWHWPEGS